MNGLVDIGLLIGIGAGITKAVDFLRGLFDPDAELKGSPLWVGVAILLGTAFSVRTGMNMLAGVEWATALTQLEGQIATGVAIGGFASGNHEFFDFLSGAAKRAHALGEGIRGVEPTSEIIEEEKA